MFTPFPFAVIEVYRLTRTTFVQVKTPREKFLSFAGDGDKKGRRNAGHRYNCVQHCSVPNGGAQPRRQSAMAIFAANNPSAWSICTDHPADPLAWYSEFRRKIIQMNSETACAFWAHDCDRHFSAALRINLSPVTNWTDNLVFDHLFSPLQYHLYILQVVFLAIDSIPSGINVPMLSQ